MLRRIAAAAMAGCALLPAAAGAHTAGAQDVYGCHADRRQGGYHCHTGTYAGLKFSSKHEMLEAREQGLTALDIRKARGEDVSEEESGLSNAADDQGGWRRWVPFARRKKQSVGNGEVIVPRGLEQRLRVVQDLQEKGLITEEEAEAKRQEILGEL